MFMVLEFRKNADAPERGGRSGDVYIGLRRA